MTQTTTAKRLYLAISENHHCVGVAANIGKECRELSINHGKDIVFMYATPQLKDATTHLTSLRMKMDSVYGRIDHDDYEIWYQGGEDPVEILSEYCTVNGLNYKLVKGRGR